MTVPGRNPSSGATSPRRGGSGGSRIGQALLALAVALALIATVLVVVTDEKKYQNLALIAALWGLVVAALLVVMYRREADTAVARSRDQQHVYDLTIEREINARREYEANVEAQIRREVAQEGKSELSALKAELLKLRGNLEELLGRDLGPSYTELQAAEEIKAISADASTGQDPAPAGWQSHASPLISDDGALAQQDFDDYYGSDAVTEAETVAVVVPPRPATFGPPRGVRDLADDMPTDTFPAVSVPLPTPEPAPTPEPEIVAEPEAAIEPEPEPNPVVGRRGRRSRQGGHEVPDEPTFGAVATPASSEPVFEPVPDDEVSAAPAAEVDSADPAPADPSSDAASPAVGEPGHHASGNSVADLLARLNSDTRRSDGGRRRRAD